MPPSVRLARRVRVLGRVPGAFGVGRPGQHVTIESQYAGGAVAQPGPIGVSACVRVLEGNPVGDKTPKRPPKPKKPKKPA